MTRLCSCRCVRSEIFVPYVAITKVLGPNGFVSGMPTRRRQSVPGNQQFSLLKIRRNQITRIVDVQAVGPRADSINKKRVGSLQKPKSALTTCGSCFTRWHAILSAVRRVLGTALQWVRG